MVSIVGMVTAILKWLYFRNVSAFYYDWLAEMCKWSDIMNNTNSSFDIFMIQNDFTTHYYVLVPSYL